MDRCAGCPKSFAFASSADYGPNGLTTAIRLARYQWRGEAAVRPDKKRNELSTAEKAGTGQESP
jgi:hypothetical protein